MRTELFRKGRTCFSRENASFSGAIIDTRAYYRAFARAALRAERQIFLAGWQFDTGVELVRGEDAIDFPAPRALLPFLNYLCETKPELDIHILAWDFSVLFGLDHQWLQEQTFNWQGHPRIQFVFDSKHPVGACHHEKLAIIDGHWAFVGGMDICENRWDVPGHRPNELRRDSAGKHYPPKHDVQAVVEGRPALVLARWFVRQWKFATRRPISPASVVLKGSRPFEADIVFGAGPVALSQTRGRTLLPPRRAVKEIQDLLTHVIHDADRSIYIENQYFTSRAISGAIIRRMFDATRGPLDVVVFIPHDRNALEFYSIAGAETRTIREVSNVARARGHRFRVYHVSAEDTDGFHPVWIHSKIVIVDDRFITIGSANVDNRSMGFDTEVNASWEAEDASPLSFAIASLRGRLLAEHIGDFTREQEYAAMLPVDALERDRARFGRVRPYSPPPMNPLVARFRSEKTILDPAGPTLDERLESLMNDIPNSPVRRGLQSLMEWVSLRPRRARQRQEEEEKRLEEIARR